MISGEDFDFLSFIFGSSPFRTTKNLILESSLPSKILAARLPFSSHVIVKLLDIVLHPRKRYITRSDDYHDNRYPKEQNFFLIHYLVYTSSKGFRTWANKD